MSILDITNRTPYDLSLRLWRVPVRVHPLFWLGALLLGWDYGSWPTRVLWVACVLVSVIVHELGHALAARATGIQGPRVIVHMMGGLCIYDWNRQTPRERLLVLGCGPAAGLALAALVLVVGYSAYGLTMDNQFERFGSLVSRTDAAPLQTPRLQIVEFLFRINVVWSLLNLLPIIPLDGGLMAQVGLTNYDRFRGLRWSHMLSIGVALVVALHALLLLHELWRTLFFLYFAGYNMLMLRNLRYGESYTPDPDPADWWKG